MAKPAVRRQTEWVPLTKEQFRERFFARFYDPAFDGVRRELEKVFEKAWDGYIVYRKSPRKRPAGKGYADPKFELPVEWLEDPRDDRRRGEAPEGPEVAVAHPDRQRLDAQRAHLSRARSRRRGASRSTRRRRSRRCRATRSIFSTSRRSPTSR